MWSRLRQWQKLSGSLGRNLQTSLTNSGLARRVDEVGHRTEEEPVTRKRRPKGTGSIARRGEKYLARHKYTDIEGRSREKSKAFRTKRDAQAWLNEMSSTPDVEVIGNGSKMTVEEYLSRWAAGLEGTDLALSTVQWYQGFVQRHLIPGLGKHRLDKLTAAHIREFLGTKKADYSPKTVKALYTTLDKAMGDALRDNLIARKPTLTVDTPKVGAPDPRAKAWSDDEVFRFLSSKVVRESRWYSLILVQVYAAPRPSEALNVRWGDVDLEAGAIAFASNRQGKSDHATRRVDLNDGTVEALKAWKTVQAQERLALGLGRQGPNDLVWTWENGRPVRRDWYGKEWRRLAEKAGTPLPKGVGPHSTRHTAATSMLADGVNVALVSRLLGHHSAAFTMDVYQAVLPGQQRSAIEARAARIAEAGAS